MYKFLCGTGFSATYSLTTVYIIYIEGELNILHANNIGVYFTYS